MRGVEGGGGGGDVGIVPTEQVDKTGRPSLFSICCHFNAGLL